MYRLYQNLPRLRFNKDGNLLAVTTADNGFKILANTDGLRTLRAYEARSFEASKASIDMKVLELFLLMLYVESFYYSCLLSSFNSSVNAGDSGIPLRNGYKHQPSCW